MPQDDLAVLQFVEYARMTGRPEEEEHVWMRLDQIRKMRARIEYPTSPRRHALIEKEPETAIHRNDNVSKFLPCIPERRATPSYGQGMLMWKARACLLQTTRHRRTDVLAHILVRNGDPARELSEDAGDDPRILLF